MSRFSPTVVPTWGQSFGNALQGGVQSFIQQRRQRLEDEKDMYGHGLQRVDPNAPATPPTTDEQAASVPGSVPPPVPTLTPADAPALAAGPPPNFKGRPTAGQPAVDPKLLSAALASHVQSGQPLQSQTSQPTPQPTAQALDPLTAPVHLMGHDWQMTPQAQYQMVMARALQAAEIRAKDATAAKDLHDSTKLQPGDAGYIDNERAVAEAQANGKLPADLALAVQKGVIDLQTGLALGQQRIAGEASNINLRGGIERGLQTGAQTFQRGQQAREQAFQTTTEQNKAADAFTNAVGEKGAEQSGIGRIVRSLTGAEPLPTTGVQRATPLPSLKGRSSPAIVAQQAAWDAAAAHLQQSGNANPASVLGVRP